MDDEELQAITDQFDGLATVFTNKIDELSRDMKVELREVKSDVRELREEVKDDRKATREETAELRKCDANQKRMIGNLYKQGNVQSKAVVQVKQDIKDECDKKLEEHKDDGSHFDKEKQELTKAGYLAKKKVLLLMVLFLSTTVPPFALALASWLQGLI